MREKPGLRRIAVIFSNNTDRLATHPSKLSKQRIPLDFLQTSASPIRLQSSSPKDLVSHPVSHSREKRLLQQQALKRRLLTPRHDRGEALASEGSIVRLRRQRQPPSRQFTILRLVQGKSSKLSRVPKHQRRRGASQSEMVVLCFLVIGLETVQRTGHAKMNFQKHAPGKGEQHSLSMRVSRNQSRRLQLRRELGSKQTTATTRLLVQPSEIERLALARVPAGTMKENFRELRHYLICQR